MNPQESRNSKWKSLQTGIVYEVICCTNIPAQEGLIVSFFARNKPTDRVRVELWSDFRENFSLVSEYNGL